MNCGRNLAPGQYWTFCGETDMGQSAPVQCELCEVGGLKLPDQRDREKARYARLKELRPDLYRRAVQMVEVIDGSRDVLTNRARMESSIVSLVLELIDQ